MGEKLTKGLQKKETGKGSKNKKEKKKKVS